MSVTFHRHTRAHMHRVWWPTFWRISQFVLKCVWQISTLRWNGSPIFHATLFHVCVYHISNNCSVCEMNTMAYFDWTHVESWQFLFCIIWSVMELDLFRLCLFLGDLINQQHTNTNLINGLKAIEIFISCTWIWFTFIFHPSENSLPEQRNNRVKHIKDWRWFQCSLTPNRIYLPFRFSISLLVFERSWNTRSSNSMNKSINRSTAAWNERVEDTVRGSELEVKEKEDETNETKNNQKIIENKTNAYRFQNELCSRCLHGPTSAANRKRTHARTHTDHFVRAKVT